MLLSQLHSRAAVRPLRAAAAAVLVLALSPTAPAQAGRRGPATEKGTAAVHRGGLQGRELCTVHGGVRPTRLAPGQGGTCELVLALSEDAVLLPKTRFRVEYAREQGDVALGRWRRLPPKKGTLHDRFEGRPVYDNTVRVRIPVRVGAGAKPGERRISIGFHTVLHHGETGKPLGRYRDLAVVEINVGAPLPRPWKRREEDEGPPGPVHGAMVGDDIAPEPATLDADPEGRGRLAAAAGTRNEPPPDPSSAPPVPVVAAGDGPPVWVFGLGGALVLALLALVVHHVRKHPGS